MRVAIYARVSTSRQESEGYSLQEQSIRLEKYCDVREWRVSKHYIDGGYSGANLERPAIKQLIEDCEKGVFDMVLVYKLDRISRSQRDVLFLIEDVFMKNNIEFASLTENLDTSTAMGRAMISILATFAALERAQIAERMAIGIAGRAKDGYWHGAACSPIGYDYEDGMLKVNEWEAMMVRKAFEMVGSGATFGRICREFRSKGYRTRYGFILPSSLRRILRRKVYVGLIARDDGSEYEGRHEAIVDDETFWKVQRILDDRERSNSGRSSFKARSALSGMVYCKRCGAKYGKVLGKRKLDGTKSRFYVCNSRNKKRADLVIDPNCRNKIWRLEDLDAEVFGEVTKLSFDEGYIEMIREEASRSEDERPARIELVKARIQEITDQVSRYTELYSLRQLDIDELRASIDPLTDEREALRKELESLSMESRATTDHAYEVARSFGDVLERGDLEEIRFTLSELIDRIEVDGDVVEIHWKFA